MNILFLTHYYLPHIGGVERHLEKIGDKISKKGNNLSIVTEDNPTGNKNKKQKIKMYRINYPYLKFLGLIKIWSEIFRLRHLILKADIVHIHDVFIWYLPFRFLYPKKKVYLTIHGLEWDDPFNYWSLLQKRIAVLLSIGSIGVGKFLEKYINCKFNKIIYGGLDNIKNLRPKVTNSMVFIGRLEPDTGLLQFLKWFEKHGQNMKVEFVGDGSLRKNCEKFGEVYGFCDPIPFYKKAETVIPSGYLTYLEAKSYGCKIKTFYGNKLKKEYWDEIIKLKKFDTWDDIANVYLKLWKN